MRGAATAYAEKSAFGYPPSVLPIRMMERLE